jgi:hypothetical protein
MTGVRIDLHVHSNASDGTDAPAEVIRRACAAELDILALTDHDTQAGVAEARAALPVGLTLVPGMELSCTIDRNDQEVEAPGGTATPRYPGQRSVHLLAYLFDPADPELSAETARIRDDRVYRARGMVALLQERGVDVTWEQVGRIAGDAVVGRPHIARAMAEAGVPSSTGTRSPWTGPSPSSARPAGCRFSRIPARPATRSPMRSSPGRPPQAWPGWRSSTPTTMNPNAPASSPLQPAWDSS